MAIGAGSNILPQPSQPVREGFGMPHNLFLSRLFLPPQTIFHTFFDYGCTTCYISSSLAKTLFPYKSITSTNSGIGGKGPKITQDVLIQTQFLTTDKSWSPVLSISAGILPDGTFPGELTLGHTIFHSLGLLYQKNGDIQLQNVPHQPTLSPIPGTSTSNFLFPHIRTNNRLMEQVNNNYWFKFRKNL